MKKKGKERLFEVMNKLDPSFKKNINERNDKGRYEEVVFMQDHEADDVLKILDERGEDAALDYLIQWHDPGIHDTSDELGHGTSDRTYEKDGYIMSWNPYIGYIGLVYDTKHLNEASMNQQSRPLSEIAREIRQDWGSKIYFGAEPYLDAMMSLDSIDDNYYMDSGRSIVAYFLANAGTWRGETAKRIKKELNNMLKK